MTTTELKSISFSHQPKQVSFKHLLVQTSFGMLSTVAPAFTARFAFNLFVSPRRYPLSEKNQRFLNEAKHIKVPFQGKDLAGYNKLGRG